MVDVVVVGAVSVDLVVSAERLPGPGETVVGGSLQRYGGGKGANAAVAAARAGARVELVGAVGEGDLGREALAGLREDGVGTRFVSRLAEPTGVALIVVDAAGENQIAVGAGANAAVTAGQVEAAVSEVHPACVLNPAPAVPGLADLLPLGPILTPNRSECLDLQPGDDVRAAAVELAGRTGAPVVVTMGGDGVLVAHDGSAEAVPAAPADVRDTTGAGDTFNGVLVAGLAAGLDLSAAVRRAVMAAGLSVAAVGARSGMPTAAAIDAARGLGPIPFS